MRRGAAIALLLATAATAHVNITTVAAGTTILINVLEIKTTIARARAAAKAAKKTTVKVVKKLVRK
jgi:hypothetical protein